MTAEPESAEVWIYIGRRLTSKGLGYGFVEERDFTSTHVFWKRPGTISYTPSIGSRFETSVTRDEVGEGVSAGFGKFVGTHEDKVQCQRWAADSQVLEVLDEAEKRGKREAKDGGELKALTDPLRDLYKRQVGPARKAALLAALIEQVTR